MQYAIEANGREGGITRIKYRKSQSEKDEQATLHKQKTTGHWKSLLWTCYNH